MDSEGEVLKAVLSLHEATEMRFNSVDSKLAAIDAKFAAQDNRFAAQETRLDRLEGAVRTGFDDMRVEFAVLKNQLQRP